MIKYFYYEAHLKDDGNWKLLNDKVLDDDPHTGICGYITENDNFVEKIYVDVEKTLNYYGGFNRNEQIIYDKLLLIETRNSKLDTI